MRLALVREEWADLDYVNDRRTVAGMRVRVSILSRPRYMACDLPPEWAHNKEHVVNLWIVRVLVAGETEPRNVALERIPALCAEWAEQMAEVNRC